MRRKLRKKRETRGNGFGRDLVEMPGAMAGSSTADRGIEMTDSDIIARIERTQATITELRSDMSTRSFGSQQWLDRSNLAYEYEQHLAALYTALQANMEARAEQRLADGRKRQLETLRANSNCAL